VFDDHTRGSRDDVVDYCGKEGTPALNYQPLDVPVLVAARLLKPLGNPPPNGIKFFAAADILELAQDRTWLVKATNTVSLHWQKKNQLKRRSQSNGSRDAVESLHQLKAV